MTTLRAAVVQLRTPATLAAALAHAEPLVRQAADQGAELIVTPEATNILQRNRPLLFEQLTTVDKDPVVQGLAALAAELKVRLLIGSALVKREDGEGYANRSVLVGPDGKIEATYDIPAKGPHFIAMLPDESKLYASAKEGPLTVFDTKARMVTAQISLARAGVTAGNGSGSEGLAPTPDGARVVVVDNDRGDLRVIDARSGTATLVENPPPSTLAMSSSTSPSPAGADAVAPTSWWDRLRRVVVMRKQ